MPYYCYICGLLRFIIMVCLLHWCTCSNAFVYTGVILICHGCLFYHLLNWCLQIDSDDELSLSSNGMPKCYVQIEHLDVQEETIDEAMELCMGALPLVLDPYKPPAFHAKRELGRHIHQRPPNATTGPNRLGTAFVRFSCYATRCWSW